jgi:hypothetical protein
MRTAAFVALLLLGPCDKSETTNPAVASSASASATPTVTVTATATVAATTSAVATPGATVGTPSKGVMTTDAGLKIVNDDKNKQVTLDGGSLTLNNNSGTGSVTQTDAGVVLKGKDGKTLTLPPVPGLK